MPEADIEREIHNFVMDNFLFGEPVALQPTNRYCRGLIDSTGVLELVDFLEENYEIKVEDEEVIPANLDSVEGCVCIRS